jgi:S-adenosylmethionine/arginine decarboxylase-like enzyme
VPDELVSAVTHLTADFAGVNVKLLADPQFVSGLLVAAAGASGMTPTGNATVRQHPDGSLSVILPLDGCHMSMHTMPSRALALLDVLAIPHHDVQRALDVCTRRLAAKDVRTEIRARG